MPDVSKVNAGQPIRFDAKEQNRLADVANRNGSNASFTGMNYPPGVYMRVKIDPAYGSIDVPYPVGSIFRIFEVINQATSMADINAPTAYVSLPTPYDNQPVILVEPLNGERLAIALVSGVTFCLVHITDSNHKYARPVDSDVTHLISDITGPVRLMESYVASAEPQTCFVCLGIEAADLWFPAEITSDRSIHEWKKLAFDGGDYPDAVPSVTGTYASPLNMNDVTLFAVTISIGSPCVVTALGTARNLLGYYTRIQFTTTGSLPTGLSVGVTYRAYPVTLTTFNIYDDVGLVTTSGTQSGTHGIILDPMPDVSTGSRVLMRQAGIGPVWEFPINQYAGHYTSTDLGRTIPVPGFVSTGPQVFYGPKTVYGQGPLYESIVHSEFTIGIINLAWLPYLTVGVGPAHQPKPQFRISNSGEAGLWSTAYVGLSGSYWYTEKGFAIGNSTSGLQYLGISTVITTPDGSTYTFVGGIIVATGTGGTSGTVPVGNGGTGRTTLTAGQVIVGDGTNPVVSLSDTRSSGGALQFATGANRWAKFAANGSF